MAPADPSSSPSTPWQPPGAADSPPGGRRRIPSWLLWVAVATAVASVISFTTVLLWPGGGTGHRPAGPLEFHRFTHEAYVPFTDSSSTTFTALHGDHGYAGYTGDDGHLRLMRFGLPDGERHWQQVVRGADRWLRLFADDQWVWVTGDRWDGDQPWLLSVRDQADGTEQWRGGYDTLLITANGFAWLDHEHDRLRGIDLRTGDERWSRGFSGDARALKVYDRPWLARPAAPDGDVIAPGPDDGRLVLVRDDRRVEVLDGMDGGVFTEGSNVADRRDHLVAFEDRLYVLPDETGYQLRSFDLTDLTATPRLHYSAPDTDRRPDRLFPCGPTDLCVLDRDGDDRSIVRIDVSEGETAGRQWAVAAPGAEEVIPVGDWLIVNGRDDDGSRVVTLLDGDGEQRFSRPGEGARIDDGNLLLFHEPLRSRVDQLSASALAIADGELIDLGRTPEVAGENCSWDSRYLLCPSREGVEVLRFAPD